MEVEDMRSKSAEIFRIYSQLNEKYTNLEQENVEDKTEITRLDNLQKKTEVLREIAQQSLEQTECILGEYSELYTIIYNEEKESQKMKNNMDKQIKKLEKKNKKKEIKLKEMSELKEKLKLNECKLEEYKDQSRV